jgi:hypothetical protein
MLLCVPFSSSTSCREASRCDDAQDRGCGAGHISDRVERIRVTIDDRNRLQGFIQNRVDNTHASDQAEFTLRRPETRQHSDAEAEQQAQREIGAEVQELVRDVRADDGIWIGDVRPDEHAQPVKPDRSVDRAADSAISFVRSALVCF